MGWCEGAWVLLSCLVSTLTHAGAYCPETYTQVMTWDKRTLTCWRMDMHKAEGKWESSSARNVCPAGCIQPAKTFIQPGSCLSPTPVPGHKQRAAAGWAAPALWAAGSWLLLSWDETCSENTSPTCLSSQRWKNALFVNWAENEGDRGKNDVITPALSSCFLAEMWVPEDSGTHRVGWSSGSVQSSQVSLWLKDVTSLFKPWWSRRAHGLLCHPLWLSQWNRPPTELKLLAFHWF